MGLEIRPRKLKAFSALPRADAACPITLRHKQEQGAWRPTWRAALLGHLLRPQPEAASLTPEDPLLLGLPWDLGGQGSLQLRPLLPVEQEPGQGALLGVTKGRDLPPSPCISLGSR